MRGGRPGRGRRAGRRGADAGQRLPGDAEQPDHRPGDQQDRPAERGSGQGPDADRGDPGAGRQRGRGNQRQVRAGYRGDPGRHRDPDPPAAGRSGGAAQGADLRFLVRQLPGRDRLRPGVRGERGPRHADPAHVRGDPVRGQPGRRVHSRHAAGGPAGGRRGRLRDRRDPRRPLEPRRRYHDRGGPPHRPPLSRFPRGPSHGLRGAVPGREPGLSQPQGGAGEAPAQRRLVFVPARDLAGTGVRLPLRVPGAAAPGDRPGTAGAGVQPDAAHHRPDGRVPGDPDQRHGGGGGEPQQAPAAAGHSP